MFAKAHLTQPIVQMVEHQHGRGQHEQAVGLALRHDRSQLGVEQASHAKPKVTVQGAGNGRQVLDVGGGFNAQRSHECPQAVHKGLALKPAQHLKPCIAYIQSKLAVAAVDEHGGIAGQNAVPAPAPVNLGAFKQDAVTSAHHAHKQADGRIHIRWQPAGGLLQRQHVLRIPVRVHLPHPLGFCAWKIKKAASQGETAFTYNNANVSELFKPARLPHAVGCATTSP